MKVNEYFLYFVKKQLKNGEVYFSSEEFQVYIETIKRKNRRTQLKYNIICFTV